MLLTAGFRKSYETPEIELFEVKCSLEVTEGHLGEGGTVAKSGSTISPESWN